MPGNRGKARPERDDAKRDENNTERDDTERDQCMGRGGRWRTSAPCGSGSLRFRRAAFAAAVLADPLCFAFGM